MNRSDCTAENRTGSIHLNLENLSGSITKSMTNTEVQFLELDEFLQHIYSQPGNLIKGVTGAAERLKNISRFLNVVGLNSQIEGSRFKEALA